VLHVGVIERGCKRYSLDCRDPSLPVSPNGFYRLERCRERIRPRHEPTRSSTSRDSIAAATGKLGTVCATISETLSPPWQSLFWRVLEANLRRLRPAPGPAQSR